MDLMIRQYILAFDVFNYQIMLSSCGSLMISGLRKLHPAHALNTHKARLFYNSIVFSIRLVYNARLLVITTLPLRPPFADFSFCAD